MYVDDTQRRITEQLDALDRRPKHQGLQTINDREVRAQLLIALAISTLAAVIYERPR